MVRGHPRHGVLEEGQLLPHHGDCSVVFVAEGFEQVDLLTVVLGQLSLTDCDIALVTCPVKTSVRETRPVCQEIVLTR